MKYLLLFVLLLPLQTVAAQQVNGVYLGGAIGANLLFESRNSSSHYETLPPTAFYLHIGDAVSQGIRIDLSAGYITLADNWNGFDFSISLKSGASEKFYTSIGINYKAIPESGGEGSQSSVYYKKNFVSGYLGAGYFIIKNAFVELNYVIPLNSDKLYGYNYQTKEILKLNGRLELSFGWNYYL